MNKILLPYTLNKSLFTLSYDTIIWKPFCYKTFSFFDLVRNTSQPYADEFAFQYDGHMFNFTITEGLLPIYKKHGFWIAKDGVYGFDK